MPATRTRLNQRPDGARALDADRPRPVRVTAADDEVGPRSMARRRLGLAFTGAGLATVLWVFYLGASLPVSAEDAHWALGWVGLDSCEALALCATGLLLLRKDNRCALTATATAVLLVIDAWFDITSAAPGGELAVAIAMALCAEIPIALVCTALALRLIRRPFPPALSCAGN
jgi:hypothetical protein